MPPDTSSVRRLHVLPALLALAITAGSLACAQPDKATACALPSSSGGLRNPDSTVFAFPHLGRPDVISEDVYTGWIALAPGAAIPVHSHSEEHEIVFVTCGSGESTVRGETTTLTTGMVMHAPPGDPHGVTAGPDGLIGVQIYRPGAPGLRFYDWTPLGGTE